MSFLFHTSGRAVFQHPVPHSTTSLRGSAALDHSRRWEAVTTFQALVISPGRSGAIAPGQPVLPNPPHSSQKSREAARVTGDSVVRVVALQLLTELLVLLLDRVMPVGPAPLPER